MSEPAPLAYLEQKTADSLFGKSPAELAEEERTRVRNLADRQYGLEARVLRAPEAGDAMVPEVSLQAAMEEVRKRYTEEEEFHADLARNSLDHASFMAAQERELRVEAVLEKVGSRATEVADIDVDQSYPEEAVAIGASMQGGVLGDGPRGQLYPELDAALFAMQPGQLSGVLESPLGYHLVWCESITEQRVLSLHQARTPIREMLEQRRKRICQQAWLKQLQTS